jgi:hypothetical protein
MCSAGICRKHLVETDRAVTVTRLLNRVEELPLKGRKVLCHKCSQALQQPSQVQGVRICQDLDEPKQGENNNLRMRPQRRQIADGGGISQ